jgi:hypothetical protein
MGHRYCDLALAVAPDGPFAEDGNEVCRLLIVFREYDVLRADLAHGVSSVALTQDGQWIAIFQRISVRRNEMERSERVYRQQDATEQLKALKTASSRLCAGLQTLRKTVSA